MGDVLICFICKESSGKIILFSEETLKKCQTILKIRKKHNLKYKNITLPNEYTDSGYHRECYKAFTGLMKKYFSSEPVNSEKNSEKKNQLVKLQTMTFQPHRWFLTNQPWNHLIHSLHL